MDVSLAGAVLAPSGTSRVAATTVAPPAATTATAPTAPASRSSVVTLSPQGQLASALGTLADTLKAAQANLASADPVALNATAQDVSGAFNALLQNIGTLPTLPDTPSPLSLVAQFLQNLDATALTDTSGSATLFGSALIPDTTTATTSALDTLGTLTAPDLLQSLLQAANATAPAQTQALLAQTSQTLATQIAAFEAQVVGSTQTSPSLLTAASLLTSDQTTATTPLSLLTQALATATTTQPGTGTIEDLLTVLSGPSGPLATLPTATVSASLASSAAAATTAATAATDTTATTTAAAATTPTTPTVPTAPITTANRVAAQAVPSTAANDAAAADQQASRAAQALQALLTDPVARVQSLVKEPLYAALIANTHLSDFVPAAASLNPNALAGDVPTAVLPAARTRAIAYYGEQIEAEARGVERAVA